MHVRRSLPWGSGTEFSTPHSTAFLQVDVWVSVGADEKGRRKGGGCGSWGVLGAGTLFGGSGTQ